MEPRAVFVAGWLEKDKYYLVITFNIIIIVHSLFGLRQIQNIVEF